MKEYTFVLLDVASGNSTVLKGFPDFNPRSDNAFQTLTHSWPGEPEKQWHPVAFKPMGEVIEQRVCQVTTSLNQSVLVLLEREF